jgi:DnaJ-like protein
MRMRKSAPEYYRALGLQPGASAKEVRTAYLRLVKQCHPDRFQQNSRAQLQAQERLKEINEAYSFLRDSRGGQPGYAGTYSEPPGYSHGATADWRSYQRRVYYEPPIVDPYEGDYQYRPVGNSRGSKWSWIFAIILIANVAQWLTGFGSPHNPPPASRPVQSNTARVNRAEMTVFAAQPADLGSQAVRSVPSPLPYFFVGSTKADVYRIQGMPQWSNEHEWRYGDSRVYFVGPMVSRWESTAKFPLKAINLPKLDPQAVISKGSSSAEVLAIQGTPVSVNDVYWAGTAKPQKDGQILIGKSTYWHYGASSIEFSGDKVIGWTEKPGSPLKISP